VTTRGIEAIEAPIEDVDISPMNVRRDVGDISELADSIRQRGILEPLIARRDTSGKYEIVIGSRRLAAARQLGLSWVPIIVRDVSDADAIIQGLIENLQRGDLSLEDRVEAYKRLQEVDTAYAGLRALAKVIGRAHQKVEQDMQAYEALIRLKPTGIRVASNLPPTSTERRAGQALPEYHATLVEQAMAAVRGRFNETETGTKYQELAKAIAPYEQGAARRIIDQFKMFPERPVSDAVSAATANVEREINLPAPTARRLEELGEQLGARNWDETIATLVEEASAAGNTAEATSIEEVPRRQGELELSDRADEDGWVVEKEPRLPVTRNEPVELPEDPLSVQLVNKAKWNIERLPEKPSFFTCGYSGRDITQFIDLLKAAGVRTIIDIRANPVSMYKPDFSKENLNSSLGENGLNYIHAPELGVPREVRVEAARVGSRDYIWSWYDKNVAAKVHEGLLETVGGKFEAPVAFMCVEADPTACHRHRLALSVEGLGNLHGYDL